MKKEEYYKRFNEENKDKLQHLFGESYCYDVFTNNLKDKNIGCRLLKFGCNSYYLTSEGEVYFIDGNTFIRIKPWTFNDEKLYVSLMNYENEFRMFSLPALIISNFHNLDYWMCKKNTIGYYDNDYTNCRLNNLFFISFKP